MLRLDAAALEFRQVKPAFEHRAGVTLVELLVAIALAGLVATAVAQWIVHTAHQSSSAQQRDDREQELSLTRNALFQDGVRGHLLEIGRRSWKLVRPREGGEPDTVEWILGPDRFARGQTILFPHDTILDLSVTPKATGLDPNWDFWSQADRDYDGLVDPDHLWRLTHFEMVLVLRRHATPARPSTTDTLRFAVPLLGPG